MPLENGIEPQQERQCSCGCRCCSSESSAILLKIDRGANERPRIVISVGSQTDDLVTGNFSDFPLKLNENSCEIFGRKKSNGQNKVLDRSTDISDVDEPEKKRAKKRISEEFEMLEDLDADLIDGTLEAGQKRPRAKVSSSSRKSGVLSRSSSPAASARLSTVQKSGMAYSASQIHIRADPSPLPRADKTDRFRSSSARDSPVPQSEASAKQAAIVSQEAVHKADLGEKYNNSNAKASGTATVEATSVAPDEAVTANTETEPGVGDVNGLTVGFFLDPESATGKTLINSMLNRSTAKALTYLVQPYATATEPDPKASRRSVTIRSSRSTVLEEESRLFTDCDWVFVCIDEESAAFSYLLKLVQLVRALVPSDYDPANAKARVPRFVFVRSKVLGEQQEQRREQLQAFFNACAEAGCSTLELAIIFGWNPATTPKPNDAGKHSKDATAESIESKTKRKNTKTTRHAKAIVRCASPTIHDSFKSTFGQFFSECVRLTNVCGDIITDYFAQMEHVVLVDVAPKPAIVHALQRTFEDDGFSHRVIDICVSNVVKDAVVLLVEVNPPTVQRVSEPAKHVARPANKPVSVPSLSQRRKLLVIDFSGRVLATVDTPCTRGSKNERSYSVSKLVFDYQWGLQHRVIVGAVETQQLTVRLGSILLTERIAVEFRTNSVNGNDSDCDDRSYSTAKSRKSKDKEALVPLSYMFFDVYKGERLFALDSQASRKRKTDAGGSKRLSDYGKDSTGWMAVAEATPFIADFAGEYEAAPDSEFAHLSGAKWGFCAIRNTLFEVLAHGNGVENRSELNVYDIYDTHTDKAIIRSIRFVASRGMLLAYSYSTHTSVHTMHFLHLNPSTKLFEPHVSVFERSVCSLYGNFSVGSAEMCVVDEALARVHLFALVGKDQTQPKRVSDQAKRNVRRDKEKALGFSVHGDRFVVSDDLKFDYEGCFPEIQAGDAAEEAGSAEQQLANSTVDENDASESKTQQSLSAIAYSQKFQCLVWYTNGAFFGLRAAAD